MLQLSKLYEHVVLISCSARNGDISIQQQKRQQQQQPARHAFPRLIFHARSKARLCPLSRHNKRQRATAPGQALAWYAPSNKCETGYTPDVGKVCNVHRKLLIFYHLDFVRLSITFISLISCARFLM